MELDQSESINPSVQVNINLCKEYKKEARYMENIES